MINALIVKSGGFEFPMVSAILWLMGVSEVDADAGARELIEAAE